ncbi:hypothetical protein OAL49_00940 [Gammaproteobacteria bacterium]|nr:hypothetical protein [Gammaproteobacteria bacterium]
MAAIRSMHRRDSRAIANKNADTASRMSLDLQIEAPAAEHGADSFDVATS